MILWQDVQPVYRDPNDPNTLRIANDWRTWRSFKYTAADLAPSRPCTVYEDVVVRCPAHPTRMLDYVFGKWRDRGPPGSASNYWKKAVDGGEEAVLPGAPG